VLLQVKKRDHGRRGVRRPRARGRVGERGRGEEDSGRGVADILHVFREGMQRELGRGIGR
jgi:hypothetical protein